jgi:hypothetical protein
MNYSFQDDSEATSSETQQSQTASNQSQSDSVDESSGYELSDNVALDIVEYSRSCIAKNEAQSLLCSYGYLSGLMESPQHFVSGVLIGTSSSGKTHLQDKIEKLFPLEWLWQATAGSDQAITYDDEWEEAFIASMDELNKPSETLIEILKSLHGDDEEFRRKVTTDWREGEVKEIVRSAKPYWFLYAQFDPDFELWNRLLKIPVHESKAKNEAVIRLQGDHHNIEFSNSDYMYDFEFTDGLKALQDHIRNAPKNSWVKLPAGEEKYNGFDVAGICRPIFDAGRSESNRVSAMVFNEIRGSALMNHKNRMEEQIQVPNEGMKDAIIAEPQDVANILSCRDVLMATTHEIDRKKMAICTAIDAKGGTQNKATIPDIIEYLRQGNAPIVNRTQVENNLKQLRENYLIEKYEKSSESGMNEYEFLGWKKFGVVEVDDEFRRHFSGCVNPITGQDFIEYMKEENEDLLPGASDFMGETDVQSSSSQGQSKLGGANKETEVERHEEAVRQALHETVDGVTVTDMDEGEPSLYAVCGATDIDHMTGDETPSEEQLEGTIFDPEIEAWNHAELNPDYVRTYSDAYNAVDDTMTELHRKGVLKTKVHETSNGEPVEMTFHISDESEVSESSIV